MNKSTGRPRLGENKRIYQLTLTLNLREYEIVKMRAEQSGSTVAVFCRRSALGTVVHAVLTPDELGVLKAFYKIGNNLNQIARALNGVTHPDLRREVSCALTEFHDLSRMLRETMEDRR